jgi:hypothetical protein
VSTDERLYQIAHSARADTFGQLGCAWLGRIVEVCACGLRHAARLFVLRAPCEVPAQLSDECPQSCGVPF